MCSGKVIQKLRELKDLSQNELAEKLNVTQQSISKLEKQVAVDGKTLDQILIALKSSRKDLEFLKKFLLPSE